MQRKVIVVVVAVAVVAAFLLWRHHGAAHNAAPSSGGAPAAAPGAKLPNAVPSKPASLAGRVTRKSDGAGIAGANVDVSRADLGGLFDLGSAPMVATTDGTGAWSLPAVQPGRYIATATATGFFPATSPRIALGSGEQRGDVTLALEAGGTLVHGTVTDIGGGPIGGVHIAVRPNDIRALESGELVTVTAADGTYQLTLHDGAYEATTRHEAYARKSKSFELAGKPVVVDFKLTPGSTVHGIVIARDTNKPVPNAMLQVSHSSHGDGGGGGISGTSGDDGTFTLTSLQPGVTLISAQARGYRSVTPTTVQLGIGEQADGVRVLVDHAFSISGKVVDKATQAGVSGVTVGGFSMAGSQGLSPDPTGSDGAFEILGVKPGSYMIFAISEDTVPDISKSVAVVDKDVTGVVVELDRGVTLSGRVDPPGAAAIGLELAGEVGLANMMQAAKTAFVHGDADATGAFTLKHVPSGSFKLTARSADGPAGKIAIVVAGVDQSGLVVTLEARASIAGHVVDSDGVAVAGTKVTAEPGDNEKPTMSFTGERGQSATSATDGSFKIVGLDAGTYKVVAGGWEDEIVERNKDHKPTEIQLTAGATKTGVTITVEAKNGVIRGQVIGGDKQPAPDSWVTARTEAAQGSGANVTTEDGETWMPTSEAVLTDDTGKFAIKGLIKGTYTLIVDGPRGASRVEKHGVNLGDNVTLELASLGTLNGHVTSNGSPVTTFELSCKGPAGPVERSFAPADGAYSLDRLAPGPYNCTIDSDTGTATGTTTVPVDSATLDFAISPWGQLSGTVVSMFDGSPVAGVSAIPSTDEGQRMAQAIMTGGGPQTDSNGHFVIGRMAAGTSVVMILSPTGGLTPLAKAPYTLALGQHLDLGTIKIVPPRQGDAGTFGMSVTAQNGAVVVTAIKPDGPAATAGLVVGDSILTIDSRGVAQLGVDASVTFLSSGSIGVGQSVQLGLARGGAVTLVSNKW